MTRDLVCNNEFCRIEKNMNNGPISADAAEYLVPVKQSVSSISAAGTINAPKKRKRKAKTPLKKNLNKVKSATIRRKRPKTQVKKKPRKSKFVKEPTKKKKQATKKDNKNWL